MGYSRIEDYIYTLHHNLSITSPEQLDMNTIAEKLNVNIYIGKSNFRMGNDIVIKEGTAQQEWQMFGHEIAHYLWHAGNHFLMPFPFIELQEWQANLFMMHFCVPTFMLENLNLPFCKSETIRIIAKTFNVELGFANKRLNMYEQRLMQEIEMRKEGILTDGEFQTEKQKVLNGSFAN